MTRRTVPLQRAGDPGAARGARRQPAAAILGTDPVFDVDLERRRAEAPARAPRTTRAARCRVPPPHRRRRGRPRRPGTGPRASARRACGPRARRTRRRGTRRLPPAFRPRASRARPRASTGPRDRGRRRRGRSAGLNSSSGMSSTQASITSASSDRRASRPMDSAITRIASAASMKQSIMRPP